MNLPFSKLESIDLENPFDDLTVYLVIGDPPSNVGVVKEIVAELGPVAIAEVIEGAFGIVGATKGSIADEYCDVPAIFVAVN